MAKCDRSPLASNAFSDSAFRRCIISAFLCGASPSRRRKLSPPPREARGSGCSDRLRDLLLLENARGVVEALRAGEGEKRRAAAEEVRRMARSDPEARMRLAAAGAVEPLVDLLVCTGEVTVVEALYGLLNLGIGNDA